MDLSWYLIQKFKRKHRQHVTTHPLEFSILKCTFYSYYRHTQHALEDVSTIQLRCNLAIAERNKLVNHSRFSEGAYVPKFIQLPCSNLAQNPSHDLATPGFRKSRCPVDLVRSCKCPNLKEKNHDKSCEDEV